MTLPLEQQLDFDGLFICTKPPKLDLAQWLEKAPSALKPLLKNRPTNSYFQYVAAGLNDKNCYFNGYLTNEASIRQQLNLQQNTDFNQLIVIAVQRWGHKINQHLEGDYSIAWIDDQHMGITASARASFSLFYTIQHHPTDCIAVASDSKTLHAEHNIIDPGHWLQQFALGPVIGRNTYLKNIRRLQPGETILWQFTSYKCSHQVKLEAEQQLKFAIQAPSSIKPQMVQSAPIISCDTAHQETNSHQLFNQLPQMAHILGEPLHDGIFAQFALHLSQIDQPIVIIDESWLAGRLNLNQQPYVQQRFVSKTNWSSSLIRSNLLQHRDQIRHRQDYLFTAFEADNHDKLTFAQWIDLHYVVPAWCQLYQQIANHYGKLLINPFSQPARALALVRKHDEQQNELQKQQNSGFFSIEDHSMNNIYDAMQRLFRSGEKTTKSWFQLAPTVTAKFINFGEQLPRQVEQTCIAMITFDYLAKFHNNHISLQ